MTGDKCQQCETGYLVVYNSKRTDSGRLVIRKYRCHACGWKPETNFTIHPAPAKRKSRLKGQI